MKAKTRNALIAAAILCIAGVVLMLAGLIPVGFDLTKLQHITMETHTEETRKPLEQIVIGVSGADVKIQASDDEVCTVTCIEQEGLTYTIAVKDKTLTVKENPDIRKWYQRIVSFPAQHHSVTVYLPKREYEQLDIRTVGGTISVTDGTYRTMQLYSANGDAAISPEVRVFSACSIHTVSGNISSRTIY